LFLSERGLLVPSSVSLTARNLSKSHGPVVILDAVNFTVSSGDRVGIVGPNGVGKSTLLRSTSLTAARWCCGRRR
jgi:ABC-type cobalamin/Fe3+-siderophores transport system ATPase subunit